MDSLLLGAAGTAFSAFIAACGYWFKLLRDRRRTTRHVLYYLLELRHRLSAVVALTAHFPDDYLTAASRSLKELGIELSDSDSLDLARALRIMLRDFATSNLEKLSREILVPYEAALLELAKDDPVLAFMLKGRESLSGPTKLIESIQKPLGSDLDPGLKDELLAQLEGKARKEMLNDMEAVVQLVARRCGVFTGYRVKRLIKEQTEARKTVTSGTGVTEIIHEMVQHAAPAIARKNQNSEDPLLKVSPSMQ